jgi:hypothetical protein
MSGVDFVQQLDKQLRYIATSCREFDDGNHDEAIRIATSLRVIFHQTGKSTSLLTHLSATYTRIRTSVFKPPYPQDWFSPLASIKTKVHVDKNRVKTPPDASPLEVVSPPTYRPLINKVPFKRYISAPDWWGSEPAMIFHKKKITRKDIVLWAANKDGGAHVDDTLPADYIHINNCIQIGVNMSGADSHRVTITAKDAHFAALRQMGFEVLESPDLLTLAGRTK